MIDHKIEEGKDYSIILHVCEGKRHINGVQAHPGQLYAALSMTTGELLLNVPESREWVVGDLLKRLDEAITEEQPKDK